MWVNSVSIPVRELVSNYYLSGDLGMDFMSPARAREGTRIHTKIQKSRPENYVSEVGISDCIYEETVELEVTGRIDGVYIYDDKVIIDEIKTTYLDLDILEANPKKTHLGQLKCYAYMYAKRNDIKHIHLQLTYYNMNSKEIRELSWECTIEELQSFFLKLVESFLKPLKSDIEWKKKRNESARLLQFPHPIFREHQREMAIWIYRTIVNQEQLLIQAPTGTGKTIASLFPAVKSFGEEKISRIFYLAARTTGKEIAENSIKAMRKAGLKLRSIILTAKEKICFNPDCKCDALECEYAKGYYDRIQAAVDEARTHQCYDRGYITSVARKHVVCPFEFSLDLTLIADCIICDYNYAFDPRVFLKRFFIDNSGNYTFLIDEAHNLVERARSMFSAELDKQEFLEARMPVKKTHKDLYKILGNINKWFLEKKKSSELSEGYYSTSDQPDDFYILINAFMFEFEDLLTSKMNQPRNFAELLELYFKVRQFIRISSYYSDKYVTYYVKHGNNLILKLICIDPSDILNNCLKRAKSVLFFSATMTPCKYFNYILGMEKETRNLSLESPFPRENMKMLIGNNVSTTYRDREASIEQIADYINTFVSSRTGNHLIFFPSYEYLLKVYSLYENLASAYTEIIVQKSGMSEYEREEFIERFQPDGKRTLVGFVVMGGIFGEGIDLHGDRLNGVVIVGVGLPGISKERDLIRNYFGEKGFDYAYLYPGFLRVMQACGRLIRSETDKGAVLLIDRRFSYSQYRRLFPDNWITQNVSSCDEIQCSLDKFWNLHI